MTASLRNPSDVVNLALRRIGYELRVGSLYDGSKASNNAIDIYAQTRDEMLRQNDWGFAERNTVLSLIKSAPVLPSGGFGYIPPTVWTTAYPALPWLFEYAYPGDCLKVRSIKGAALFVPNFDPQPVVFGLQNDNALTPPAKVILCNVASATLCYTGQVTDPTTWEADFAEALADELGRSLVLLLKDLQTAQIVIPSAAQSKMVAETEQG